MVKHNNQLMNNHFRKDWQRYVKTWFDQPAKKVNRRNKRLLKAKTLAPRPVGLLRPAVRGQTVRYNMKLRAGKGFSLDELRAAGVSKKQALTIGISIDWRRKNRSQEGFLRNVKRLNAYKSKLVVFPRKGSKPKAGDSPAEDLNKVTQSLDKRVLPIVNSLENVRPRALNEGELEENVFNEQVKARAHAKLWGKREKIREEKLEAERQAALKKAKKAK